MTGSANPRSGTGPIVLLDTNLLLIPFRRPFNLTEQLVRAFPQGQAHVPSCVLDELDRMNGPNVKAARELAATLPVHPTPAGEVDDVLAAIAPDIEGLIATNDRELIQTLRAQGLPVLRLKGNDRLVLEGHVG